MEQGLYRHVLDGILSYLRSHPLFAGSSMWDAARLLREKHRSRDAGQPCRTGGQESGRPVFQRGREDGPSKLLQKRSLLSQTAPSSPWTYPKMPSNAPHGEETTSAGWFPIFPGFH